MIALIDADIICYSVAFAAKDDPLPFALHSVNKMIDNILDKVGAEEYYCFLSGPTNFRNDVATIKKYKGNRKSEKPEHYADIRKYLIDKHEATVIDGQEADDALGIMQTKLGDDTCIASIDKDLDQIAGWHYNWRRDEKYYVYEQDADLFFYKQLLMGDSTDNIQGIPRVGEKGAENIITTIMAEFDAEPWETLEEELYWEILDRYAMAYDKPMEALIENARLLWIRRQQHELWEPKW
ncbi:hypothetical protein OAO19_03070 [Gammaproteobacteria bacterium]|nr:hypothetical protein [Gammaproteobacteria bacterium]